MQILSNTLSLEKQYLPAQAVPPKLPMLRSESAQIILAGGIYSYLLNDCLTLFKADASVIEREYGIPLDVQYSLGYRSVPECLRLYSEIRNEDVSRWLDSLSDDQFCDWFTYSKTSLYSYQRPDMPAAEYRPALSLIEQGIIERFGCVEGIPGLYVDDQLRVKMPHSGVLVPCRIDSIIRALLHYPRPGEDQRFWFSSNGLRGGAKASASLHFTNESRAVRERICVIVSHTLQADAIAWATGECVVAVNGISPLKLPHALRAVLPDLRGCVCLPELGDHLIRTLRDNGLRVRVEETESADEN